jgi:hypothetical protein
MQRQLLGALMSTMLVAVMALVMMPIIALADHGDPTPQGNCPEQGKVESQVDGDLDDIVLDAGTHVCIKAGAGGAVFVTADGEATLRTLLGLNKNVSHYTVIEEPEVDLCDPTQKPGGMDIAAWLAANDFEASDCFEFEVSQSCGFLDAELTRNDTPYTYLFVWNYGDTPDLGEAQLFPATFEEDENDGEVTVTYYIVGPEKDYFVGYGIPNFWEGGETVTVETDCEEDTTTSSSTTTTTQPEETTTTTVPDETTTTVEVEDTVITTTTISATAETLPFTGLGAGGLASLATSLLALGSLVILGARSRLS